MTALLKWDGLGVNDETTLTTGTVGDGDTAPSAIVGTSKVDVDKKVLGGSMIRIDQDGTTPCNATWTLGSVEAVLTIGFAFTTPSSWSSTAATIFQAKNGAASSCYIILGGSGQPGQVRQANGSGSTTVQSTAGTLATTTDYWFCLTVDYTLGTPSYRVVVTNIATGTVVWDPGAKSSGAIGTGGIDRFTVGATGTNPVLPEFFVGRILADDSGAQLTGPADVSGWTPPAGGPTLRGFISGGVEVPGATLRGVIIGGSEVAGVSLREII